MAVIDILPPEQESSRRRVFHHGAGNVSDASFVTIRRTVRDAARPANQSSPRSAQSRLRGLDEGAARLGAALATAERRLMRLSADLFAAVVATVFVAVFGLSGGFSLFLGSPLPVAAPGLDLTHVNLTAQEANGIGLLLITGIVKNNGEHRLEVPAIHAVLVADGVTVASTVIEPPVSLIEGGNSHGFSARVRHPGGKTPELQLSFASAGASAP